MSATKQIPARFRDRDDAAYRQAHRDAVVQHQIDRGHSPAWIAVLPEFRALDLRYYARFRTDHEFEACRQAGEEAGQLILDFISRELAGVEANRKSEMEMNDEDLRAETNHIESRKKPTVRKERR